MAGCEPSVGLVDVLVESGFEICMCTVLTYAAVKTLGNIRLKSSAITRIGEAKAVPISGLQALLESQSPGEQLVICRGTVSRMPNNYWFWQHVLVAKTGQKGPVLQQSWVSVGTPDELLLGVPSSPRLQKLASVLQPTWDLVVPPTWTSVLRRTWASVLQRPWLSLVPPGFLGTGTSLKMTPFALSGEGGLGLVLVNLQGSTQPIPLTTVFSPPDKYFNNYFTGFFCGRILEQEKLLEFGKVINAVGICSLQDGYPRIKPCSSLPYFLTDLTRDQMLENLTHQRSDLIVCCVFLGFLSVGFFSSILFKHFLREQSCLMCQRRMQKYKGEPCGHMACCEGCLPLLQNIWDLECNFCRKRVTTFVDIGGL